MTAEFEELHNYVVAKLKASPYDFNKLTPMPLAPEKKKEPSFVLIKKDTSRQSSVDLNDVRVVLKQKLKQAELEKTLDLDDNTTNNTNNTNNNTTNNTNNTNTTNNTNNTNNNTTNNTNNTNTTNNTNNTNNNTTNNTNIRANHRGRSISQEDIQEAYKYSSGYQYHKATGKSVDKYIRIMKKFPRAKR